MSLALVAASDRVSSYLQATLVESPTLTQTEKGRMLSPLPFQQYDSIIAQKICDNFPLCWFAGASKYDHGIAIDSRTKMGTNLLQEGPPVSDEIIVFH